MLTVAVAVIRFVTRLRARVMRNANLIMNRVIVRNRYNMADPEYREFVAINKGHFNPKRAILNVNLPAEENERLVRKFRLRL